MFIKCYEMGRKRKARELNLKCRCKSKVMKLKRKKVKFQRLMALEEADPAVLKRDVLHLVLHHPDGVKFGDFAGAFLQLHGFHPQLALHGYRSLKDLVTDMKDVVVLEGDSQNPVIKIANDLELYQTLEGDEYGWDYAGWDDSEEESQSLLYEEAETEEASDVLELITSLLNTYKTGLRIEKLQALLLAVVDLEKFSIAHGYKDTLEFLEHQMTELTITYLEDRQKCVVQLTADTAGEMQPPVSSSSCNTVLQPGLTISSSCPAPLQVVPLDSSKKAQNPEQSIEKDRTQNGTEPPLSTNHVVSQVKALLSTYGSRLRLEKVQEFLLAQNGVDLEKFSIAHGYREALAFLKHQIPELTIHYSGKRKKCVLQLTENTAGELQLPVSSSSCKKVLQTGLTISSSCPAPLQDVPLDSSKTAQNPEQSIDKNRTQNGTEPPLSTNHVVSQVKAVLSRYTLGLKIKKLQEILLTKEGVDLEKFIITQGYKDTLKFLKRQIPELIIQNKGSRPKCVVRLTADTTGQMQPPVSSSSCEKVLQTGLTISSSCLTPLQDVPPDSVKIAQNSDPIRETNRTGIEPSPGSNYAVSQIPVQSAMAEGDSNALKRKVLQLVLQNPKGVKFGNFSGAFQQLHGFHPQLSLYGYRSLRDVLSEMKDVVIVCVDSQGPVIKVASNLDLEGGKENENEQDDQDDEKTAREDAEVLKKIIRLLSNYKTGLRIEKLQEFMLAKSGVDLEKFSIAVGYKGTLELLEKHLPEIMIRYRENHQKCVVQLIESTAGELQPPDSRSSELCHWLGEGDEYGWDYAGCDDSEEDSKNLYEETKEACIEILELITSLLSAYMSGLRIEKLQEFLLAKHGVDLERFSIARGYQDTLEFLEHQTTELTITYRENREKCVVRLTADTAEETQLPVSSSSCEKVLQTVSSSCPSPSQNLPLDTSEKTLNPEHGTEKNNIQNRTNPSLSTNHVVPQGQMVLQKGDPGALKRNLLHLVLQHPEGVAFGDFTKAFQQLHGYCPQLTSHGYSSLSDLVDDMNGTVVLEGDFQNPLLKVASESHLYQWLEGGEGNQWNDSEKKAQSWSYEEGAKEDAGFSIAFVAVRDILKNHVKGLKMKKLKEAIREKYDFDLERVRSHLGYKDIVCFLQDMPGLHLRNSSRIRNCVVELLPGPSSPAPSLDTDFSVSDTNTTFQEPVRKESGTHSHTPCLDTDFCAHDSNAIPEREMTKKPDLTAASVLVLDVLGGYPHGLNLKALKENLETKHRFDLDTFSQDLGYEDVLVCLLDIPGLCITYLNGRKPQHSIIQLLSGVSILPSWLLSPGQSLDEPLSSSGSDSLHKKPVESKPDSCISTSTQISAPLSLDSKETSTKSETSSQMKVKKEPALEDVLALLSSILSVKGYKSGLKLEKVQKRMTGKGVNLEKFSIAQGHKNSLAFLECHMPELKITYHEDQRRCVVKLESDSGVNSVPPLLGVPALSTQPTNSVPVSHNSTDSHFNTSPVFNLEGSANQSKTMLGNKPALEEVLSALSNLLTLPKYKSGLRLKKVKEILLTMEGIDLEKFSIAQGHKDSLAFLECHMPQLKIRNQEDHLNCLQHKSGFEDVVVSLPTFHDYSSNGPWIQSLPDPSATIQNLPVSRDPYGAFSDQLSEKCQLRRPPPMEDIPSFSNAPLLRRPNLNGPHHLKDLDELKQEIAHILARHPEGISLFQFRVDYSAAFQKHLQLGNASSAKQFLLEMPDVVCLKGYGVQTLLFPVTSKEPSLKSGHQITSRVEDATVVPSHSLSTVTDQMVDFQPSPRRATIKPQPRTVHPLTSGHLGEPDKTGGSFLSQSEGQSVPKPRPLLQEHGVARARLGDPSVQSHLSNVAEAAVAPGCSLSKTDPVMVPKSSAPTATVAPVPQPHSFPHLFSECLKQPSNKKSPQPNTSPPRAPKATNPEEEASARTRQTPLIPSSPVVSPSDWDETPVGFASKPTQLPTPQICKQNTLPFLSPPLPASFMPWTQPLVFPPTMFLSQHVPSSYPSNVYNTSRLQPQNMKPPSSHFVQSVPQMRLVQPISPFQSTEQMSYVYPAQGHGLFSQEKTSSRTVIHTPHQAPAFSVNGIPASLPFQNPPGTYASRSQTIYQTEYYSHPWQDDAQCRSMQSAVSAADNSITTTSSATAPSQSTAYWSQSVHVNKIPISRTPATHLPPTPSNVSHQASQVSRHTSTHTLPSSDSGELPQILNISNKDPQAFKYTQQYVEVCSTTNTIAMESASSVTSPVYCSTDTSGQPSYISTNTTTHAAPNQPKSFLATSKAKEQDNLYVRGAVKQNPHITQRSTDAYSSGFQDSPPKISGKCVIL